MRQGLFLYPFYGPDVVLGCPLGMLADGTCCPHPFTLRVSQAHRHIVLTDHQSPFVELLAAPGPYQNASGLLREGQRLVGHREAAMRLTAIRDSGHFCYLIYSCLRRWDKRDSFFSFKSP